MNTDKFIEIAIWVGFFLYWPVMGLLLYYSIKHLAIEIHEEIEKRKKRNEIVGFFAGFFFGILAIIYYLIVGEPSVPCAFCRKKVSREALICPYCRKKLETA